MPLFNSKLRISTKLLTMNLLVCATFVVITGLVFFSFRSVEENLLEAVGDNLNRVILNADTSRTLSTVFAQTNLLLATFHGNDEHVSSEGNRLLRKAHELMRADLDPAVQELLGEFTSRLALLLQQCATVNDFLRRLNWIDQEIHHDLNQVEQILADRIVDMVLQSKQPTVFEQLSVMVSGYRESMLRIGKMQAELKLDASSSLEDRQAELVEALDNLELRLMTLSASSPDVAGYGQRLSGLVSKYRDVLERYFRALSLLKVRMAELDEMEMTASTLLTDIDEEIAAATTIVQEDLTSTLTHTRTVVGLLSLATILFLGAVTARFIVTNLTQPMGAIRRGIDSFRNRDFEFRIDMGRNDEWNDIEQALNTMARDIKLSYAALNEKNTDLERTQEELRSKVLELEDHIRARKLVEEELADLNYHLEQSVRDRTRALADKARELEATNKRLTELDSMKSAFLSSVSHELRTPLTSVLGFAKLISKDFTRSFLPLTKGRNKLESQGERIVSNLKVIILEGERLTRLINDVLDLSRIEEGRVQWNDTRFSLESLLTDATRSVGGFFESKEHVDLVLDLAPGLPALNADQDRILQVLLNLLNNAGKFTDQGEVRLSARSNDQGDVVISVSDTGPGVAPDQLDHIFNKFYQVNNVDGGAEKPKGTGLGLAICRNIVEHYKGTITAASTPGEGSVFTVVLPREVTTPPQEES